MKIKIYVGCALTHATEEYRKKIEGFKNMLREKGFEVMDFLWAKLPDPRAPGIEKAVYEWDIEECVGKCDLFVAICDEVSIGMGYELGTAVEKYGKPAMALIHKDGELTRVIRGITHPNFTYAQYENFEDAVNLVLKKAENLSNI